MTPDFEAARASYDPCADVYTFVVTLDGRVVRGARTDREVARRLTRPVEAAVDFIQLEQRYMDRPRPRLGAGTRGYRGGKR